LWWLLISTAATIAFFIAAAILVAHSVISYSLLIGDTGGWYICTHLLPIPTAFVRAFGVYGIQTWVEGLLGFAILLAAGTTIIGVSLPAIVKLIGRFLK
jgi:hypothetical protein